jgi:YVTN family beta-propeller protein
MSKSVFFNSLAWLLAMGLRPTPAAAAPFVYVANFAANTVAVIDTAFPTGPAVVATVPVPVGPCAPGDCGPAYVAINPDGLHAYVTLAGSSGLNSVAVIDTALALTDPTNAVVATVPVANNPQGVAITPDGAYAYVVNEGSNSVSVIDTALALANPTGAVVATVLLEPGSFPGQVVISPDGADAWVTEPSRRSVAVIDTALVLTNPVAAQIADVPLELGNPPSLDHLAVPFGLAINPDGAHVYLSAYFPQSDGAQGLVIVVDTTKALTDPLNASSVRFILRNLDGLISYKGPFFGIAVAPDGVLVYLVNGEGTITAPEEGSLLVLKGLDFPTPGFLVAPVATIPLGRGPFGVGITQDGSQAYVTNTNDVTVSAINVALNSTVGSPIPVGPPFAYPFGLAITPSAAQGVAMAMRLVQLLGGSLNVGQQTSLIAKLNAVLGAIGQEHPRVACNQVGAFLNEGNAFVQSGQLTQKRAAPALHEGQAIQIALGCASN